MQVPKKAWIFAVIAALVVLAIVLFDWNLLRSPIAHYLSAKLGRPVAIDGNLSVDLSTKPLLTAASVTVGNAPWSSDPAMAEIERAAIRVDLFSLLFPPVAPPEITLTHPRLLLERAADGHANWELDGPTVVLSIGSLNIEDGVIHYRDPATATDVTIKVASSASSESGQTPVRFSGTGRLHNNAFTIEGSAASLLSLENADKPYLLSVSAKAGDTSARFNGTVVPARIDTVDGLLTLQGRDLSQLYPMIPVPLPWTPAYRLSGKLRHDNASWSFREFTGKVGDSDLAGNFVLEQGQGKIAIDADLVSQSLNYKDLGGIVGLPPANEAPGVRTAAQSQEVTKREQSDRVLPSKPYDLERLRVVDAKARFKGKRFMASDLPLDNVNATLDLKGGVLRLQPLDFGLGGGHVVSTLALDARDKIIKLTGDVTVRSVDLKQIMPKLKPPNGSAGTLGGQANFTATGNSIADMLASSNGEIALISRGGDASELAVVLTNLDLARAAQLLLGGDANSPVRCVVADFVADNGNLVARNMVIDTDAEKILGTGTIDFARERYDLTLKAQSKNASVVALRGPILVDGSFKSPRVHPAAGPIAARVGTSVALGAALTPLAALLPLIDFGGATDAECGALIQDARQNVQARAANKKGLSTK